MSNLVERLRERPTFLMYLECADRIESLERVARMALSELREEHPDLMEARLLLSKVLGETK